MLKVTIESNPPSNFEWQATSSEFEQLWNHCEESTRGHDPNEVAQAMLRSALTGKPPIRDAIDERGRSVWIVYAILRAVDTELDFSDDGTFDLAEAQTINATIRLGADGKTCSMELVGRPPLDS